MVETLVRLKGELTSAGFDAEIVDIPATPNALGDPRADLEHVAVQRRAQAVVAIVGDLSPDSVEVWVVDNVTGKSSVRRVSFDPGAAAASEALAIRAIEILRSSFLEIEWATDERQSQPGGETPPVVVKSVESERLARRADKLGVEVGGAAVTSLSGIGPALMPLLRFDWSLRPWLLAQATFAGLGTRPSVDRSVGSADISQAFGWSAGSCASARASGYVRARPSPQASCTPLSRGTAMPRTTAEPWTSGRFWSMREWVLCSACPTGSSSRSRLTCN
jgi:hypothetical protein